MVVILGGGGSGNGMNREGSGGKGDIRGDTTQGLIKRRQQLLVDTILGGFNDLLAHGTHQE